MPYVCPTGKIRFATLEAAELRLLEIEREPSTARIPSRAYACNDCGGFHLTSQSSDARTAHLRAYPTADGSSCHGCGKPIAGKAYIVSGHPECGRCFAAPRVAIGTAQRH